MLQPGTTEIPRNGHHPAGHATVAAEAINNDAVSPPEPRRNRLPDERISTTHKFQVASHEGYLTVGLYPDGRPGEIFIVMAKEGSTVSGLISSFAQSISIGLQYGVPLKVFCEKFSFTRFEPAGWTGNPAIPQASSVMDYIFRWLRRKFLPEEAASGDSVLSRSCHIGPPEALHSATPGVGASDAPSCKTCGSLMRRNGSCYACGTCGWTSGCS